MQQQFANTLELHASMVAAIVRHAIKRSEHVRNKRGQSSIPSESQKENSPPKAETRIGIEAEVEITEPADPRLPIPESPNLAQATLCSGKSSSQRADFKSSLFRES